jgi:hypothetical protein
MIKTETFEGRELKVLNLIIKQHYFDAILDGRKVQEFREVRPTTVKNLLQIDEDGYEVEDEKGNSQPIKYDAIRFYVGYNKDRDTALVEVKDAYCEIFVDDNKEAITYEYGKDPKTGEPMAWIAEQVVFNLGKILETDLHKHDKI